MLFSGVGPFRQFKLLFTVEIMVLAQVTLITPIVVGAMESYVSSIAPAVRETARGLALGGGKTLLLLMNECTYQICSAYLLAFFPGHCRGGGGVHGGGSHSLEDQCDDHRHHAVHQRGDFSLGIALGMILLGASLLVNLAHISAAKGAEPMKIQTFTKSYEGRRVLEVPELELEGGKIYGVIGANGSGKSTFAKVLAGVVQADIPRQKNGGRACAWATCPRRTMLSA